RLDDTFRTEYAVDADLIGADIRDAYRRIADTVLGQLIDERFDVVCRNVQRRRGLFLHLHLHLRGGHRGRKHSDREGNGNHGAHSWHGTPPPETAFNLAFIITRTTGKGGCQTYGPLITASAGHGVTVAIHARFCK